MLYLLHIYYFVQVEAVCCVYVLDDAQKILSSGDKNMCIWVVQ